MVTAVAFVAALGQQGAPCAPAGKARIAEILYDAIGDDTGQEFVELYHPGASPLALAGLRLEAGDGAGPGRWTLRWTGGDHDSIGAGARFVIGGDAVVPAVDALASLALQNGPDAVRLVWPDGEIEVVGYGALAHAEYACGSPAADVPSGFSLARVPDDADLGSNALDFQAAAPSPGRPNVRARDLAVVPGTLRTRPERPETFAAFKVLAAGVNRGVESVHAGDAALVITWRGEAVTDTAWRVPVASEVAAGDSIAIAFEMAGRPAGRHVLVARLSLPLDEAPDNDADSLVVRVGTGPIEVTEIQFHPAAGEGEWVEVLNRSSSDIDPTGLTLSDRSGTIGAPRDGSGTIAPEVYAVFAQNRASLLSRFPALDPARVWQVAPWGALNNSDDSEGVADIVRVREADGTISDQVAYSARGVPNGVPLERIGAMFWPSLAPLGTPLGPPPEPARVAGAFDLLPRRIRPHEPLRVAWELPWETPVIALDLFDLAGRHVASVLEPAQVARRGEREFALASVPPGVYAVLFTARPSRTGDPLHATRPLRIEAPGP